MTSDYRAACAVLYACVLGALVTASGRSAEQTSPAPARSSSSRRPRERSSSKRIPKRRRRQSARIVELVKKNFYNGQRFHRAEPKFVVQIGDPQTRNMQLQEWWGRSGFGKPIGVSEITKKRRHLRGAVAMAYAGADPRAADSQFYIMLAEPRPSSTRSTPCSAGSSTASAVADRIREGRRAQEGFSEGVAGSRVLSRVPFRSG